MGELPVFVMWAVLYLIAPTFLIIAGRLALASSGMLLAAFIPWSMAWLGNIDNPALPLMTLVLLPLPLMLLLFASVRGISRLLRPSHEGTIR